nr:general negative regulator of transcription subunit 3 isoform X2 [Ipomoea batatas]
MEERPSERRNAQRRGRQRGEMRDHERRNAQRRGQRRRKGGLSVSELESQIDSFEAELERLTIKKGKSKPPRLVSLSKDLCHLVVMCSGDLSIASLEVGAKQMSNHVLPGFHCLVLDT